MLREKRFTEFFRAAQPGGVEPALNADQAELHELHRMYCSMLVTVEKQKLQKAVQVTPLSL